MGRKTNKKNIDEAVVKKKNLGTEIWKNRYLYALLTPGMICLILFRYFPIAWLGIAFQDYKLLKGMSGSEWVGFKHFIEPKCGLFYDNKEHIYTQCIWIII